jgi:hypothetical protein
MATWSRAVRGRLGDPISASCFRLSELTCDGASRAVECEGCKFESVRTNSGANELRTRSFGTAIIVYDSPVTLRARVHKCSLYINRQELRTGVVYGWRQTTFVRFLHLSELRCTLPSRQSRTRTGNGRSPDSVPLLRQPTGRARRQVRAQVFPVAKSRSDPAAGLRPPPENLEHDPEKPALGLDPGVDTGFPKRDVLHGRSSAMAIQLKSTAL